ncbi:MAG: hypothetical protein IPL89_07155 [Acidobacteria bacterium]|nr:hypothetical protein [Acidobacteriota bacterium]
MIGSSVQTARSNIPFIALAATGCVNPAAIFRTSALTESGVAGVNVDSKNPLIAFSKSGPEKRATNASTCAGSLKYDRSAPSTAAIPSVFAGYLRQNCRATGVPMLWPTRSARSTPASRMTASTDAANRSIV